MPVEPTNLPVNLAAAEQSQASQITSQHQDRVANQVAAGQSVDQAKQKATDLIQGTQETENPNVHADEKGAAPHTPKKEGKNPAKGESPPATPPLPDPAGRGRIIDLEL